MYLRSEAAFPGFVEDALRLTVADSDRKFARQAFDAGAARLADRVSAWRSAIAETSRGAGGRGPDGRPVPVGRAVSDLEAEIYSLSGDLVAGQAAPGGGRADAVAATRALAGSVPGDLQPLVLAAGQRAVDGLPAEAGGAPLALTVDSAVAQALQPLLTPDGDAAGSEQTMLAQALLWRAQADSDRTVAEGLKAHAARVQARDGETSDAYRLAQLRADRAFDRAQVSATLRDRCQVAVDMAAADPARRDELTAGWRQVNAALAPLDLSIARPHPSAAPAAQPVRDRKAALDREVELGLLTLNKADAAVQLAEAVKAKGDEAEAARLDKVRLGEIVASLDRSRTTPRQVLLQEALEASADELLEHGRVSPERTRELARLRVEAEAEAAWLAQHPAAGSDLAKETGQRRGFAEADKREALALAQKERLSRELDQQMLAGDGLRIEQRVQVSIRAVAAAAPASPQRRLAEAELQAAQEQRQQHQTGDRQERIATELELARLGEEVARRDLDLEEYKTNVLGANQQRNPHQFDTAFTDGRGDLKQSDRIEIIVKDGQLYQQNSHQGEVTGTYQLSWGERAPTKMEVPRGFDGLSGALYQARLRLDGARRQAAQRAESSLKEQQRDIDARLATARATFGPGVQGPRKGDDAVRPKGAGADWVPLEDGRWVHPQVAALVAERGELDGQQAQTARARDFLEFRLSHPDLVGLDDAHDERLQAHYAREREAVRQRYFAVYDPGLAPIPLEAGAERRNALGRAMGFAVPEGANALGSTDLFAGEQLAMIEWVDRRIGEAVGDRARVVPSLLLHVSDEVGVKPIVHLQVQGQDGETALIDTSLAYEAAIRQANVPWRFDDLEDWRAGNTLSDKGTVYGRGADGQGWSLAAHDTSTVQTVITWGTMAADVASLVPGGNVVARPLAFAGNAYLGANALTELAAINRHGQSVWSKEGLMTAGSAAVSSLGVVAPALRAATLYRGGLSAGKSLRASVGATGHQSLLSSQAGHVLANSGEFALRLAHRLDQGQFFGGTALMAASAGDVAAIDDFTGEDLLNLMDFATGLHGTIAGGIDIIALNHATASPANRPASDIGADTFPVALPHGNPPAGRDHIRTDLALEPATI
ncbi:hypothetical protein IB262_35270, partial [Ensifer sp. ENS02]|nr:hypothetical protein [Ensifer sp. ENS02]